MLKNIILVGIIGWLTVGCTENTRTKRFGGTMTINVPPTEKFINATWKDDELWYLTRDRREGETPENWKFQEKSSFGMIEGTIIFHEQ